MFVEHALLYDKLKSVSGNWLSIFLLATAAVLALIALFVNSDTAKAVVLAWVILP